MLEDFREDLRRYGPTRRQQIAGLVLSPGAWATAVYRASRWLETARAPGPLRKLTRAAAAMAPNAAVITSSIQIPASVSIGPGLYLPHTGYIVMSLDARIGSHCTITQGVTIGHGAGGREKDRRSPRIGDRVYIGPGAIVLGDIDVGDDALIGAGAVVLKSVPPRAVVAGNPARILSYRGSFDLVRYPGMDDDPARRASLEAAREEQATV